MNESMNTEGSHDTGDLNRTVADLRRDVDNLLEWRVQLPAPLRPEGLDTVNRTGELTVSQAAAILGVHRSNVWRRIKAGQIPAHRLPEGSWRIPADTLTNTTGDTQ